MDGIWIGSDVWIVEESEIGRRSVYIALWAIERSEARYSCCWRMSGELFSRDFRRSFSVSSIRSDTNHDPISRYPCTWYLYSVQFAKSEPYEHTW